MCGSECVLHPLVCVRTFGDIRHLPQLLSSGTCGCHGYDLTQGDDYKLVLPQIAYLEFYIGEFDEDIQRQVVETLCSGVVSLGDMDQVG